MNETREDNVVPDFADRLLVLLGTPWQEKLNLKSRRTTN
jgi:hypothetical protein